MSGCIPLSASSLLASEVLRRWLTEVGQLHAPEHLKRLEELDVGIVYNLDSIAPWIEEIKILTRQTVNAGLGNGAACVFAVVDYQPYMATAVGAMIGRAGERNELIAQVDERHGGS